MDANDLFGGPAPDRAVPRIEGLRIQNYRALKDLSLAGITPLTVLLGPNGSGKSTLFDVFAFLSECFSVGLRKAWDRRGRFKELRTRGCEGPIVIELKYRENPISKPKSPLITYHLAIEEGPKGPYVAEEWLRGTRKEGKAGGSLKFIEFTNGKGTARSGEMPDESAERVEEELDSPEMLAVNTLGQLARHPRVSALRRFITSWYLSYITADSARGVPEAGPQERLSATGNNLPNVIQYLKVQHREQMRFILERLSGCVPCLENVDVETIPDGRLLLQFKDAPFEHPIQARFVSAGTLQMLAYLTVLHDPSPPQLVGIEEPENHLHPSLLPGLVEECRLASGHVQLMVTTHSPYLVDEVQPDELWVLCRNNHGYAEARRAADMAGVSDFLEHGATLGSLWMEGHFDAGDPLVNHGGPRPRLALARKR